MLGDEPDQAMDNRTTDFNPDCIGMILFLVSELVKLGFMGANRHPSTLCDAVCSLGTVSLGQ